MVMQELTVAQTRWKRGVVRNSLDSRFTLNNEPAGFIDRSNVEYKSKMRI